MQAIPVGRGTGLAAAAGERGRGSKGCASQGARKATPAKPSTWTVKRTPWGDPDLRGSWPVDYLAQTPRQRPEQYGTRAELTDEEFAAATKSAQTALGLYDKEEKAGKIGLGH